MRNTLPACKHYCFIYKPHIFSTFSGFTFYLFLLLPICKTILMLISLYLLLFNLIPIRLLRQIILKCSSSITITYLVAHCSISPNTIWDVYCNDYLVLHRFDSLTLRLFFSYPSSRLHHLSVCFQIHLTFPHSLKGFIVSLRKYLRPYSLLMGDPVGETSFSNLLTLACL